MQKGFWKKFSQGSQEHGKPLDGARSKPILIQAPMADVTDAAFRRIIAKYGKPDVMWTEFVSCDGLCSEGKERLLKDLWFDEVERPIVAQFFGAKPENFYRCAKLAQELGFDGIDINMGCPVKTINKQSAGADLINDPELAKKIIKETKRGAGRLPVSVKTRVGYNKERLDEWLPELLLAEPVAITIHARTKKEMSVAPARWDLVAQAKELAKDSETLIIGNGDVKSLSDASDKARESGADGVMVGRALFGNPWFFSGKEPSLKEKLLVVLEHAKLYEKLFLGVKSFALMRKHFGSYVSGFAGAKELRNKLMGANNLGEVERLIAPYLE